MSNKIEVKAVEGRIARVSPRGAFIPHDRFIPVVATPYILRLRDVHGDIEERPKKQAKAATPPAPTLSNKPETAKVDKEDS